MADRDDEIGLGTTAEDFYRREEARRTASVSLARRLADITIPSMFPPEHWQGGDELAVTNQSITSFAVNTLANKMTLTALPPNLPICHHEADEAALEEDIKQDPELYTEITYALSRRDDIHSERLRSTSALTAYGRASKLFLVTGNVLILWTDIDKPRVYNMHNYVVVRDSGGEALVTVLKDSVVMAVADDDVRQAAKASRALSGKGSELDDEWEDTIDVFHVEKLVVGPDGTKEWVYWQEVEGGHVIADTEAWSPYETPTMKAATGNLDTGSNWGTPYVADYEGDITAVETFAGSLQDGAAALAWFLFMVDPSGLTDLRDVQKADSLDVLSGRAQDITVVQANKGGDLSVISAEAEKAARRLGYAFALQTSIQRSGERVTREEWVRMSSELDQALGGLYTEISQGLHRWFVLRFLHLHVLENPKLAELPTDLVKVRVATGVDNIGMDSDYQSLMDWATDGQTAVGPEAFAQEVNRGDILRRLATFRGIKTDGLMLSEEQKTAAADGMRNDRMQQTLLEKGTAPLAKEGAAAMAQMMAQQQQGADNGGQG